MVSNEKTVKPTSQSKEFLIKQLCIEIKLSIHVSIDKKTVFDINLIYGGVFQMKGYSDDELKRLINSFCPNMLFPYARQVVSQTTTQAGFPPLNLSPIDFEARYRASNS